MNLNATNFDLANARACAQASADAYRLSTVSDPATDTHCLVLASPDAIIIAFRGTNSIRNWITDADFKRSLRTAMGAGCKVHAGFLAAFDGILGPLTDYLAHISVADREVFVTGHSLGGALAILAATALRPMYNVAQVYTFGQPRLGNAAFKRLYEEVARASCPSGSNEKHTGETPVPLQTFRLVYQEDIVPRIPHLPAWHDPYRHVGTEVFIPSHALPASGPSQISNLKSEIWMNPPWWRVLLSDLWGLYRAFVVSKFRGALDPALDHFISNYIVALAGMAPEADADRTNGTNGTNNETHGQDARATQKLAGEPPALQLHL